MPAIRPEHADARPLWPQHHRAMERLELFADAVERLGLDVTCLDTAAASRACLTCGQDATCRLWMASGAGGLPPGCANGRRFQVGLGRKIGSGGHGRSAEMPMDDVRVPA